MRAGELRHRITIQRVTATVKSATGAGTRTWDTFAEVWAKKRFVRSGERTAGGAGVSELSVVFDIRPLDGVTKQMRVLLDGHFYNITGIDDSKLRDQCYSLFCTETANPDL